jgi:hypothetical protein
MRCCQHTEAVKVKGKGGNDAAAACAAGVVRSGCDRS